MTKKVAFASGLCPDWNSGSDMRKGHPKKRTDVQILVGGLDDSDVEAVNPFSTSKSSTLTEEDLAKVGQRAKCDPSHRNDVNTSITSNCTFLIWIHTVGFSCHG